MSDCQHYNLCQCLWSMFIVYGLCLWSDSGPLPGSGCSGSHYRGVPRIWQGGGQDFFLDF